MSLQSLIQFLKRGSFIIYLKDEDNQVVFLNLVKSMSVTEVKTAPAVGGIILKTVESTTFILSPRISLQGMLSEVTSDLDERLKELFPVGKYNYPVSIAERKAKLDEWFLNNTVLTLYGTSEKYERLIITNIINNKTADFDTINNYKLRIDFNGNVAKKNTGKISAVVVKPENLREVPQSEFLKVQLDKNTLPATGFNQGPLNLA